MTESCRGRKGNCSTRAPNTIARPVAYDVLVRNSIDTRSMFAITCRPSLTTFGRCENLPSSRMRRATALVAWAPEFIAMPMSASLIASASFTPSPVIATVLPCA